MGTLLDPVLGSALQRREPVHDEAERLRVAPRASLAK